MVYLDEEGTQSARTCTWFLRRKPHAGRKKVAPLRTCPCSYTYIYDKTARVHARYHERIRGIFCLLRIRPLTKPDDARRLKSQACLRWKSARSMTVRNHEKYILAHAPEGMRRAERHLKELVAFNFVIPHYQFWIALSINRKGWAPICMLEFQVQGSRCSSLLLFNPKSNP